MPSETESLAVQLVRALSDAPDRRPIRRASTLQVAGRSLTLGRNHSAPAALSFRRVRTLPAAPPWTAEPNTRVWGGVAGRTPSISDLVDGADERLLAPGRINDHTNPNHQGPPGHQDD
jgi:hypothetical protein